MSENLLIPTGATYVPELRPSTAQFLLPGRQTSSSKLPQSFSEQIPVLSTLETRVFDSLVRVKVFTSKVANHLSDQRRKQIFRALDRLHEIDEWEQGDCPIIEQSFKTFICSILTLKPDKWPSLGLTSAGYLFAIWGNSEDRLNVEFLEENWVNWAATFKNENSQTVRGVGTAPAEEIRRYVKAYNPEHWFDE